MFLRAGNELRGEAGLLRPSFLFAPLATVTTLPQIEIQLRDF